MVAVPTLSTLPTLPTLPTLSSIASKCVDAEETLVAVILGQ